jgi:hypothetical protein
MTSNFGKTTTTDYARTAFILPLLGSIRDLRTPQDQNASGPEAFKLQARKINGTVLTILIVSSKDASNVHLETFLISYLLAEILRS